MSMAAEYRIRDAGIERSYYSQIPNMIDDAGLSPSAFRLYVHLKRVAGSKDGGACFQSTTTLADNCGFSTPTIVSAKKELLDAGLIEIEERRSEHGEFPGHWITIANVWEANELMYSKENRLSPDDLCKIFIRCYSKNLYGTVQKIYTGLYKKFTSNNNPLIITIEEKQTLAPAVPAEKPFTYPLPPETLQNPPAIQKEKSAGKKKQEEKQPAIFQPMFGKLAAVCQLDMKLMGTRIGKTAKILIAAGYGLENLETFLQWWNTTDFRGMKGQAPTLDQVITNINKARGWIAPDDMAGVESISGDSFFDTEYRR
jgi:hypothetical protein